MSISLYDCFTCACQLDHFHFFYRRKFNKKVLYSYESLLVLRKKINPLTIIIFTVISFGKKALGFALFFGRISMSPKLWPPLPPSAHLGDEKKSTYFLFFYYYFIRNCTQTRGDNTESCFNKKKVFHGMLNITLCLKKVDFFSGRGLTPPPPDRRHVS